MEITNIFNQLGNQRYTWREGVNAQSNKENAAEEYYRSRSIFNTQLTGKHLLNEDKLDWSVGYAFANRSIPDRRRYLIDDAIETDKMGLSTGNANGRS